MSFSDEDKHKMTSLAANINARAEEYIATSTREEPFELDGDEQFFQCPYCRALILAIRSAIDQHAAFHLHVSQMYSLLGSLSRRVYGKEE